jgi:hypothetical protein
MDGRKIFDGSTSKLPLATYHGGVVPARQAYSHCASVGSCDVAPSVSDSHAQNADASLQDTFTTGCSSV